MTIRKITLLISACIPIAIVSCFAADATKHPQAVATHGDLYEGLPPDSAVKEGDFAIDHKPDHFDDVFVARTNKIGILTWHRISMVYEWSASRFACCIANKSDLADADAKQSVEWMVKEEDKPRWREDALSLAKAYREHRTWTMDGTTFYATEEEAVRAEVEKVKK